MGLTNYRLGDLIERRSERNTDLKYGIDDVRGISGEKYLMATKADLTERDLSTFRVVRPNDFAFNRRTSRMGGKWCIAYNETDKNIICTEDNVVFSIKRTDLLLVEYLFMYINRSEFDRRVRFLSWGSASEFFNWEDMCNIVIPVPPAAIQRKYVRVYLAMKANLCAYESGNDDLRLVCDMMLEKLKHTNPKIAIGTFIQQTDIRNTDNQKFPFKGLSMDNYFIDSIANDTGLDFSAYKIVRPGDFGCVLMKIGRDCKLTIAQNISDTNYLISPAYYSFSLSGINPLYFMGCVSRHEFERHAWFMCDTSTRGSLSWQEFCRMEIPDANDKEQQTIANIYITAKKRKSIAERLKSIIKSACPVLIKGAIDEARKDDSN